MIGIYFSGTGNSRYVLETFLGQYDESAKIFAIEDENVVSHIKNNEEIVFSYSVQYSNIPKMLKDFVDRYQRLWQGKKIFVIATMGLFSGDGTGCSARLLKRYGANIIGGLHLKMPDCIGDVKLLKKSIKRNKAIIKQADLKIKRTVINIKKGKYSKEGLHFLNHITGLFGQRLWFYNKTLKLKDKLNIDYNKCISCGKCSINCPTKNLKMIDNKPIPQGKYLAIPTFDA